MAHALQVKLREFGFSDKEAKVYEALSALGSSVVSDIAKRAGIKRSTAYVILDALAERGMVSISSRRGVKLYQAAPAERLVKHVEETAKRYAAMAAAAKKLLPELKRGRAVAGARPRVQLFEGPEGIKTVYGETLASLEKIRAHTSVAVTGQRAPAGARAGISVKTEINVYDNKVVFISPVEQFAFVVESKELATALKRAFAASGKETKRLGRRFVTHPALAGEAA